MLFHFKLDGLEPQHQADLLAIEATMTPRSAYAAFTVKTTGLRAHKDVEGAYAFLRTRMSAYHLDALKELLEKLKIDLDRLVRLMKNVPTIMSKRPAQQ
jgi:hypothetical protein